MAETGIEDFAREPFKGCLGSIVPAIVFTVILFTAIALISAYCGPGDEANPKQIENSNR